MEEINIKEYLNNFSKYEPIYFIPNPGNSGDILISCATFQVFNQLKMKYCIVDSDRFDARGKTVFYGGGGNLVPYYDHARKAVQRIHKLAKKTVILPHTISNNDDLLQDLGTNVDIICREPVSFNHVKKIASRAHVMLSSDMAFHLETKNVLSNNGDSLIKAFLCELVFLFKNNYGHMPGLKELNRFLRREIKMFKLFKQNESSILTCFRTQAEKTGMELCTGNIDISLILAYGKFKEQLHESIALWVSNQMLRFINQYNKIATNRLHVAIAAALLGKDVDFYRNSYYKNEAVYRYSLEGKFPNVRWMG